MQELFGTQSFKEMIRASDPGVASVGAGTSQMLTEMVANLHMSREPFLLYFCSN